MQDERTAQRRCSTCDSWQVSFYLERHACYLIPALSVPKSWDSTIPGECSPEECVCLPVLVYFALDKHEDG